jgi:phage gpG-like protein
MQTSAQDSGVLPFVERLINKLEDLSEEFDEIGALIVSRVQTRFDLKQDPDGNPWDPWAPSTARERAREGRGTLLEYTGRLRSSYTHSATRDGVEIGSSVPYAGYMEEGVDSRHIPARHMLLSALNGSGDVASLGHEDEQDVLAILKQRIDSLV